MFHSHRVPRLIVVAGALVVAPSLRAQEVSPDTTTLSPVVVTATRVNGGEAAPLVSTTVLDGAALRAQGITTVADALEQVPGALPVQTGSFGGVTSLFLRGGESDYVQFIIDGRAVNDPGGFVDLANLTTDNVDRIEIVRGPTSVLYGSNAVSGVVQIFTRDGRGARRLTVSGRGGTYGSDDFTGSFLSGGAKASISLDAAHHGSDGIFSFNSQNRDNVFSLLGRIATDSLSDVRLAVRYIDAGVHIPTNYYGAVDDSNQFHYERRWIGSVDAGHYFTKQLEGRLLVGVNHGYTRSADAPDSPGDQCFCYDTHSTIDQQNVDGRVNYHFSPALVLTGGAAYEHQRRLQDTLSAVSRDVTAGFLQALGTIGTRLSYTVGGRVDDNSAFGTFGTYRAAVGYLLGAGTHLRASVGNAFKEPTFDEVSSTAAFARGNPDLKPERSQSWDVGAEQELAHGALVVGVTYFQQRFRDLIQYNPSPPTDSDPNYINIASADANGIETEVRATMGTAWSATATYTWLDTKVLDAGVDAGPSALFVEGQPLVRRPKNMADLQVAFRPSTRGLVQLAVHYVGDRTDIDFLNSVRVTAPSYTVVDFSGEVAVLHNVGELSSLAITARFANLFDESYQSVYGFQSPGRTVLVGGRMTLGR